MIVRPFLQRFGETIRQAHFFAAVGVLNTIVDVGIFAFLTKTLSIWLVPANIVSFLSGAATSYLLNRNLTFARTRSQTSGSELWRFALVTLLVVVVSTVTVALLSKAVDPLIAKCISVGVTFAIGFVLQKTFVFRPSDDVPGAREENGA